jgi:DNA primase
LTDGSGAIPTEALQRMIAQGGQVLVAFDADGAGEKMTWRVAADCTSSGEGLERSAVTEQGVEPKEGQTDRQAFKVLWKWYWVAAEIFQIKRHLGQCLSVFINSVKR